MVHVQYPAMVGRQTCDFVVAPSADPGIRRVRRGRGFSYQDPGGTLRRWLGGATVRIRPDRIVASAG